MDVKEGHQNGDCAGLDEFFSVFVRVCHIEECSCCVSLNAHVFAFARFVKGMSAPERAMVDLFCSCVARFVIQPTALHWTSTLNEDMCFIKGVSPPRSTMSFLFALLTAKFPRAVVAARCTSTSSLSRR